MTGLIFYKKNGAYLRVLNVTNASTDALISDATVTASLQRWSSGGGLAAATPYPELANLTLTAMPGTEGGYEGLIDATFDPSAGTGYRCVIDIVKAGIESAHFEVPVEVKVRS